MGPVQQDQVVASVTSESQEQRVVLRAKEIAGTCFLCNDELPPPQSYTWTMCDEANHTCPVPTNPSHAWMLHSLVRLSHSAFSEAPKGQVNPDPNPLCCVQAATLLTPVVCRLKLSKLAVALPAPQLLGSPESCCSATLNGAFVVMP